jgi:AraC-like DNA-binding protein
MTRPRRWIGRLFARPGRLLYVGAIGTTGHHAHHAFQIMVGRSGPLGVTDEVGVEHEADALIIQPDTLHALTRPTSSALMLFVDPDDLAGRRLRRAIAPTCSWRDAARPLSGLELDDPKSWTDVERLEAVLLDSIMGPELRPKPMHPALLRALREVEDRLDGDVSLGTIAAQVEISTSRLSHLFSEELGIPLRPYVLWRRLMRAAENVQRGASLTEAAHAAGFSDGAHMNHAFKRMFGISPSELKGAVEWILPEPETN